MYGSETFFECFAWVQYACTATLPKRREREKERSVGGLEFQICTVDASYGGGGSKVHGHHEEITVGGIRHRHIFQMSKHLSIYGIYMCYS